MSEKRIDLTQSVYELSRDYPEIVDIMTGLGFAEIGRPGMLAAAGRFMTIPKGARMKGIDLKNIKAKFIEAGFSFREEGSI